MALFVSVREVSVEELMRIAASNEYSVSYTPFGRFGLRTYIKRAVPWKGVKGDAFWEIAGNYVGEKKVGLKAGLEKAIEISKKYSETYGVALVRYTDGSYGIMPLKSAKQAEGKKVESIIHTAPNYFRLLTTPEAAELVRAAKLQPVVY